MISVPSLESQLTVKLASSDQPKGQHLTFNVLSSTFGSHYIGLAFQLRLEGWVLPGADGGEDGGLGFWPLLPLWLHLLQLSPSLHQLPYSTHAPLRAFELAIPSAQILAPDICVNNSLISFRSLLKCLLKSLNSSILLKTATPHPTSIILPITLNPCVLTYNTTHLFIMFVVHCLACPVKMHMSTWAETVVSFVYWCHPGTQGTAWHTIGA